MAYAYVVRGYQDDVIGVFTNKKKAIAYGVRYVKNGLDEHDQNTDIEVDSRDWIIFIGDNADVEKFRINCEY